MVSELKQRTGHAIKHLLPQFQFESEESGLNSCPSGWMEMKTLGRRDVRQRSGSVKQSRAAEVLSSRRKYTHWTQLSLAAGLGESVGPKKTVELARTSVYSSGRV